MLRVSDLEVSYGAVLAVRGAQLELEPGVATAIVGPNGAGKSSLLSALAGVVPARGEVLLAGRRVDGLAAHERARAGLAFVPDGRRLFGALTVEQNLVVAATTLPRGRARAAVAAALARFPRLAERRSQRADTLSGGEGQLVMIARALVPSPRVLLVDEPFHGLSVEATELVLAALLAVAADGVAVALASPESIPDTREIAMLHGRVAEVAR